MPAARRNPRLAWVALVVVLALDAVSAYRATAQPKFPEFAYPVPDVEVTALPTNALIGLDGTRHF